MQNPFVLPRRVVVIKQQWSIGGQLDRHIHRAALGATSLAPPTSQWVPDRWMRIGPSNVVYVSGVSGWTRCPFVPIVTVSSSTCSNRTRIIGSRSGSWIPVCVDV